MYHAALEASMEAAKEEGPYSSFKGSPASEGILQFDMWNVTPSNRYDWDSLKLNIAEHGLQFSFLLQCLLLQHPKSWVTMNVLNRLQVIFMLENYCR